MVSTYCRVSEGKEGETLVQCRGILSDYSENTSKLGAGEECFQIFLIKEDYTLEEQTLCERKGFVEFDREVFVNERLGIPSELGVAMNFEIKYGRDLLGNPTLQSIIFSPLQDTETAELAKQFRDNKVQSPRLRTDLEVEILETGYYYMTTCPEELLEGYRLGQVFFYTGEIKNVNVEGENLVIRFSFSLYGQNYLVELSRESFEYIGLDNGFEPVSVDSTNYREILPLDLEVQVLFRYIPRVETGLAERLRNACENPEPTASENLLELCTLLENRSLEELVIEDMDIYMREVLDDLDPGEVAEFDKLIFNQIIFR
jgi:hypothetical protein